MSSVTNMDFAAEKNVCKHTLLQLQRMPFIYVSTYYPALTYILQYVKTMKKIPTLSIAAEPSTFLLWVDAILSVCFART